MPQTEILFCRPVTAQALDDRMDLEAEAAEELGIAHHPVVLEDVVDGEFERALELLPQRGRRLLYRGWMLTEDEYSALYEALLERGHTLVVSPDEYAAAHYLPNYHPELQDLAVPARWTFGTDLDEAWEAARELGEGPWVLKDHVKSVKERWHHCCFVPGGASRERFIEICENLIEERGERFERGLVIRPYVPLRRVAQTEERPLHYEFRLFFASGRLIASEVYDDVDVLKPDLSRFASLGRRIDSPFFTADVAMLESGDWVVVELGDGGVSTLPPLMDPRDFYRSLQGSDLWDEG
ncbi:ATP-grasp domain-containing protein [Cystobacter ferrugineus]|nr:ATP-grasp domain-containing protein [Cystobacter ferrugineus]